jgi:hypothetical protein
MRAFIIMNEKYFVLKLAVIIRIEYVNLSTDLRIIDFVN